MMSKKILVWMSWGVDSAVSAYLLQQQGYEVAAGFMKNYADEMNPHCQTKQDRDMAIKVAQFLGIQTFIIFDFREEYSQRVLDYLYSGYSNGLTPNPDILCNSEIKFKLFLEKALELGFDGIATGHYVVNQKSEIRNQKFYRLLRGVDKTKDQSYFLAGLNQEQLSRALFPVGEMLKSQVRELAHQIGLPNADRKDSQGLCFVWNVPMKEFLQKKLPIKKGNLIDKEGNVIGKHDGAWFYTIGQRRWIGHHEQVYVIATDVKLNTVMVGEKEDLDLLSDHLMCENRHWIGKEYDFPLECMVKIRYRQEPVAAKLHAINQRSKIKNQKLELKVEFEEKQRAIAPGQIVAAYVGDELVWSWIII